MRDPGRPKCGYHWIPLWSARTEENLRPLNSDEIERCKLRMLQANPSGYYRLFPDEVVPDLICYATTSIR